MKKLLFVLSALFVMTMCTFANSSYDTVYFKPNTSASYPLVIDKDSFPFLDDEKVSWFVGFEETNGFVAREVLKSEIQTINGTKYLHNENLGTSFDPSYKDIRTMTLFYGYKLSPAIETKGGETPKYLTKDDFKDIVCDTTAVLHVVKELEAKDIKTFISVGNSKEEYHIGDTAKYQISLLKKNGIQDLDVEKYLILGFKKDDDITKDEPTILGESETNLVTFVVNDLEDYVIYPAIKNEFFSVMSTKASKMTVLEDLEITEISTELINSNSSIITTNKDSLSMTANPMVGDSLVLKVKVNVKESKLNVKFAWNKNGNGINDDNIKVSKDGTYLEFANYDVNMNGVYNCVITNTTDDKVLGTVTFNIMDKGTATSNEDITISENYLQIQGDRLLLNNVKGMVKVINMNGQIVKSFAADNLNQVTLNVPQGIYVINSEKQTLKAYIKH